MDPMGLGDNLKTPKVLPGGGINNHEQDIETKTLVTFAW